MAGADWLRTFVAIYRSGSVSGGAAHRGLSQPAASQQLAALERRVGLPLFTRTPGGVEPTRRGRELHAEVADSLDRLEHVLAGLELDVTVTSTSPGQRSLASSPIGLKRFALVGAPAEAAAAPAGLEELGPWLAGRAWVAYSAELPVTRRFWQSSLGRPFSGDLRLVAPDLRAVVAAVEHGLGISLLPEFACAEALARGTVAAIHPVAGIVPTEPWFACTRRADLGRPGLTRFTSGLRVPAGPSRPGPVTAGAPVS